MTETEYLNYMGKYKKQFKVESNEDGNMLIIKGKYGQIEPHGEDTLQVWYRDRRETIPPISEKRLEKLKNESLPYLRHYADLTGEGLGVFSSENIGEIVTIIRAKKKASVSPERREQLRKNMLKVREKLKANK